jgi:signal transduction histidine kinase
MIESVLDWARMESGRKTYSQTIQSPTLFVEKAMAAFRAQRLGLPYELIWQPASELPEVRVDTEAMAGALLNLLQNAYKYTGPEKRIVVRARTDKQGIAIDVEDNGMGIARKDKKRIFERFYRVDGLLTRSTEGSGLGLSIAERIVKAHKGRISVKSEPGRGATFTLHLPKAETSP